MMRSAATTPRLPVGTRGGPRGFTMVELIVAVVVGAIVAGAATAAMANFLSARTRSAARREAFGRADAAAARIAGDAVQVIRDSDLAVTRLAISDAHFGSDDADGLLLFVRSAQATRGGIDNPEGLDAEVQYKLMDTGEGPAARSLWRRSDPMPDKVPDGGGLATRVSPGVVGLSVLAYDGSSWLETWDSDASGLPLAIAVTATGISDDGTQRAAVRRVVAIDRVPLPPEDTGTTDSSGTTGTTDTTGGAR